MLDGFQKNTPRRRSEAENYACSHHGRAHPPVVRGDLGRHSCPSHMDDRLEMVTEPQLAYVV